MHTNFDTKNTHYETVNKKKDKWIFKTAIFHEAEKQLAPKVKRRLTQTETFT